MNCFFRELTSPLRAQAISDLNLVLLAATSDVTSGARAAQGLAPDDPRAAFLKPVPLAHQTQGGPSILSA